MFFQKKKEIQNESIKAVKEPPMDNLPEGNIDWEEISQFVIDMLDSKDMGNKGWKVIDDPASTEKLQENSIAVLKQIYKDLFTYFARLHGEKFETWEKMEQYIRTKYSKLSEKALSRIIANYKINDR